MGNHINVIYCINQFFQVALFDSKAKLKGFIDDSLTSFKHCHFRHDWTQAAQARHDWTQAAQAQNMRSYIVVFFNFYANVQQSVTCEVIVYVTGHASLNAVDWINEKHNAF